MINLTPILICLLLFSCTSEENKKNDLIQQNLIGNVKTLMEYDYWAIEKFGEVQRGDKGLITSYSFDTKGNKKEMTVTYSDGSESGKYIFDYDSQGNLTEENKFLIGILVYKDIYKYDNKGKKLEKNKYNSDGSLISKWTYNYDDKGNIKEENYYKPPDGSEYTLDEFKETYRYDNKGNIIEQITYRTDGGINKKMTFQYDDKGNLIEKNWFDLDNRVIQTLINKYDENGNILEEDKSFLDVRMSPEHRIYQYKGYDEKNNWLKKITFSEAILR